MDKDLQLARSGHRLRLGDSPSGALPARRRWSDGDQDGRRLLRLQRRGRARATAGREGRRIRGGHQVIPRAIEAVDRPPRSSPSASDSESAVSGAHSHTGLNGLRREDREQDLTHSVASYGHRSYYHYSTVREFGVP